MFTNDPEAVVEDPKVEPTDDLGEDPKDLDTTDWKAEAIKARGIAKRNATKLEKFQNNPKGEPSVEKTLKTEIKGFDYAEKAYLKASGIQNDEFGFVQEVMKGTGKSLDEVLEAKYFQSELKERRDAKASKDAIPSGSKRSAASARDSVEYWLAKGELPPADQKDLRIKVVNARIAAEKQKSNFTDRPVV